MRTGPVISPFWCRYSCSKNGTSDAAFSTGISAAPATVRYTTSCAAARDLAAAATAFAIRALFAAAAVADAAGVSAGLGTLERYFFAVIFLACVDVLEGAVFPVTAGLTGATANARPRAASPAMEIDAVRITSWLRLSQSLLRSPSIAAVYIL